MKKYIKNKLEYYFSDMPKATRYKFESIIFHANWHKYPLIIPFRKIIFKAWEELKEENKIKYINWHD